jgi:hypothetical protein
MDKKKNDNKAVWVIFGISIVLVGLVAFLVFSGRIDEESMPVPVGQPEQESIQPEIKDNAVADKLLLEDTVKQEKSPPAPVNLQDSDAYLQEQIDEYVKGPLIKMLFREKGVIRKIVAIVDNLANGESPKNHLEFLPFSSPFRVVEEAGRVRIDERSYTRYDTMVDAFISIDSNRTVNLFKITEKLFNAAYKDLGYPKTVFRTTLVKAIKNILAVDVVFDKIYLEKGIVCYKYKNDKFKKLTDAQKQFLRMGPMNLRKIHKKIKEIRELL